jgi:ppGpp synthetase/RelA/SpoT-type nucleotidyltranferase
VREWLGEGQDWSRPRHSVHDHVAELGMISRERHIQPKQNARRHETHCTKRTKEPRSLLWKANKNPANCKRPRSTTLAI